MATDSGPWRIEASWEVEQHDDHCLVLSKVGGLPLLPMRFTDADLAMKFIRREQEMHRLAVQSIVAGIRERIGGLLDGA